MNTQSIYKKFISYSYTFKKINPSKKYASFEWFEIDDINDAKGYIFNGAIIKHRGVFYQYAGAKEYHTLIQRPSTIEVKDGNKVFASFNHN